MRNRILDNEPDGEMTGRVPHVLKDFNGDGVTDLGIFELKGGDLIKMHFSYELHHGREGADGIRFETNPATRIDLEGIPVEIIAEDFDNDGRSDIAFMVIEPGFVKNIGMIFSTLFTNNISLDLRLYRLGDEGFDQGPTAVRKVKTIALGEAGEPAATFPEISFQDVDSDGHQDLMVETATGDFQVYSGGYENGLFAKKAYKHKSKGH